MPKVITDAMKVVRELGYRYLWMDRLCIPQAKDEDSIKTRAENISQMGLIYATSVLTIIAAAGDSPEEGLAGVSPGIRSSQPAINVGDRSIVAVTPPIIEISESVWNTRGWTFQEAFLSRRRLVFTESQVYFQCQEEQYVESLTATVPFSCYILTPAVFPPYGPYHDNDSDDESDYRGIYDYGGHGGWINTSILQVFDIVKQYAYRKFTNADDAYDAFRGILLYFKSQNPPVYFLMGLPILSPDPRTKQNSAQDPILGKGEGDQERLEEPSDEIKELSLALSWSYLSDNGSEFGGTADIKVGMARRTQFSSWSWLGWENCPDNLYYRVYDPDRDESEVGPMINAYHLWSAKVHFHHGNIISWDSGWRRICDKSETCKTSFMDLDGLLLDLPMEFSVDRLRWGPPFATAFKDTTNFYVQVSKSAKEAVIHKFGGEKTHLFTSLLLASSGAEPKAFGLLLLDRVQNQPGELALFERLDFVYLNPDSDPDLNPNLDTAPKTDYDHDDEQLIKEKPGIWPDKFRRSQIRLR
ncbi:hypothetical protein CJF30_00011343 [Rutstroemia sp. NJR-2017a BBW]|nr:hypothetical protein CJF30_00011343 [Rutstroemia sp. NJR-2017a BBW]